eukprot:SAG25_NODE_1978_length_2065_cov_1.320956_1_plen_89_part_00
MRSMASDPRASTLIEERARRMPWMLCCASWVPLPALADSAGPLPLPPPGRADRVGVGEGPPERDPPPATPPPPPPPHVTGCCLLRTGT